MSDTLTKKLRRAATLQHTNGTPNATPNTIPQSFRPPCCQLIATAVAKRKATDVPLNTTPRIAAFLAVHSLTEIWYGRMVGETRRLHSKPPSTSAIGIYRQSSVFHGIVPLTNRARTCSIQSTFRIGFAVVAHRSSVLKSSVPH